MAAPRAVSKVPGTNKHTPTAYTKIKNTGAHIPADSKKLLRAVCVKNSLTGVNRMI
jgi:hypothetical protein